MSCSDIVRIDIDFPLRSKSNYRRRANSNTWSTHRSFEDGLALLARSKTPKDWDLGDAAAPLSTRPVIVMLIAATSLLDTSNLSKSVADALEGVLYHNDASIRLVTCLSQRQRSPQRACVLVRALPAGAEVSEMTAAAEELFSAYLADPSATA